MKKILAAVLAAAMSLGMASAVFADVDGVLGNAASTVVGSSPDTTGYLDFNDISDKAVFSVMTAEGKGTLYQFDSASAELKFLVDAGYTLDVHVVEGPIAAKSVIRENFSDGRTGYGVVVTSRVAPTDLETRSWRVSVELEGPDGVDKTCQIKGKAAYSGTQTLESGDRQRVTASRSADTEGSSGSIFAFSGPFTETARVRVGEYVDLYFQGDYGETKANLRMVTDSIPAITAAMDDQDIEFYTFVGKPSFAQDVTVLIDADSDSNLYTYDEQSGSYTRIHAPYESDGWKFQTRKLGTYFVTGEEFSEGNVKSWVELAPSSLEMYSGASAIVSASVSIIGDSDYTGEYLWSVSDESVATIQPVPGSPEKARVTARAEGSAVLTLQAGDGLTAQCSIRVLASAFPDDKEADFIFGEGKKLGLLADETKLNIQDFRLYTYNDPDCIVAYTVSEGDTLSAEVEKGPVAVQLQGGSGTDRKLVIRAKVSAKDGAKGIMPYTVRLTLNGQKNFYITGQAGYSDVRSVYSGGNFVITESRHEDDDRSGSVFRFDEVLDTPTSIQCVPSLQLVFGNHLYEIATKNLRVVTDSIPQAEKMFKDAQLSFYRFIAPASFAKPVTVKISGNENDCLYEYNDGDNQLRRLNAQYADGVWTLTDTYLTTYILSDKRAAVSEPENPSNPGTSTVPDDDDDNSEEEIRDTVERQAASNNASDNSQANVRGVTRLTQEALRAAGSAGNATVRMTNVNFIGQDALQAAEQAAAGQKVVFHFDQAKKGVVESRLYIDPAQLSGNGKERLSLKVTLNEKKVTQTFERHYSNALQTITFSQKGGFGGPVELAARLDLSGMDTKALRFYHYDAASNSFYLLPNLRYFVDTNGYLHVQGIVNTDTLIVTDRPMARR